MGQQSLFDLPDDLLAAQDPQPGAHSGFLIAIGKLSGRWYRGIGKSSAIGVIGKSSLSGYREIFAIGVSGYWGIGRAGTSHPRFWGGRGNLPPDNPIPDNEYFPIPR